jgi:hypothetical protein
MAKFNDTRKNSGWFFKDALFYRDQLLGKPYGLEFFNGVSPHAH